ncbi:MAG: glycosyltransferase [Candidatus Thorarchaeota archaeon]
MNIILSAFYCHPNKGSEQAVGWNWLVELSKENEIYCLFYAGEDQKEAVQEALRSLPQKNNIHLYPIGFSSFTDKKIYYRLKYELWQIKVFFITKRIIRENSIDLIHGVTISAWWFTGYYWMFNIPLVLGPLLGGQVCPKAALSFLNLKHRIYEVARSMLLSLSSRVFINSIISIKKARLVIAGNNETLKLILKLRNNQPTILLSAAGANFYEQKNCNFTENKQLKLLWVGLLIHRKNFGFLLKCLEKLPNYINWRLKVVGGGKLLNYWEKTTALSPVNNKIEFLGNIDFSNVVNYYNEADIFLFPSLREGSPAVILEAMSYQLPVIAFNINGAETMLNNECGVLIPVKEKKQMVDDFVNSIIELYENPNQRIEMGKSGRKIIEGNFLWEKRGIEMNKLYDKYIKG